MKNIEFFFFEVNMIAIDGRVQNSNNDEETVYEVTKKYENRSRVKM